MLRNCSKEPDSEKSYDFIVIALISAKISSHAIDGLPDGARKMNQRWSTGFFYSKTDG